MATYAEVLEYLLSLPPGSMAKRVPGAPTMPEPRPMQRGGARTVAFDLLAGIGGGVMDIAGWLGHSLRLAQDPTYIAKIAAEQAAAGKKPTPVSVFTEALLRGPREAGEGYRQLVGRAREYLGYRERPTAYLFGELAAPLGVVQKVTRAPRAVAAVGKLAEKVTARPLAQRAVKGVAYGAAEAPATWAIIEAPKPAEERTPLPIWVATWLGGEAVMPFAGAAAGAALRSLLQRVRPPKVAAAPIEAPAAPKVEPPPPVTEAPPAAPEAVPPPAPQATTPAVKPRTKRGDYTKSQMKALHTAARKLWPDKSEDEVHEALRALAMQRWPGVTSLTHLTKREMNSFIRQLNKHIDAGTTPEIPKVEPPAAAPEAPVPRSLGEWLKQEFPIGTVVEYEVAKIPGQPPQTYRGTVTGYKYLSKTGEWMLVLDKGKTHLGAWFSRERLRKVSPPPEAPPVAPATVTPREGGFYRVVYKDKEYIGTVEKIYKVKSGAVLATLKLADGTKKSGIPITKRAQWFEATPPRVAPPKPVAPVEVPKLTPEQARAVDAALSDVGLQRTDISEYLTKRFGTSDVGQLTLEQAQELINHVRNVAPTLRQLVLALGEDATPHVRAAYTEAFGVDPRVALVRAPEFVERVAAKAAPPAPKALKTPETPPPPPLGETVEVPVSKLPGWAKEWIKRFRGEGPTTTPVRRVATVVRATRIRITPPTYDWGFKKYVIRDPEGNVRLLSTPTYDTLLNALVSPELRPGAVVYMGGEVPLPLGYSILEAENTGRHWFITLYENLVEAAPPTPKTPKAAPPTPKVKPTKKVPAPKEELPAAYEDLIIAVRAAQREKDKTALESVIQDLRRSVVSVVDPSTTNTLAEGFPQDVLKLVRAAILKEHKAAIKEAEKLARRLEGELPAEERSAALARLQELTDARLPGIAAEARYWAGETLTPEESRLYAELFRLREARLAPPPTAAKPYEGLTPGTPEWMKVWREHPELQDEMVAYAKERGIMPEGAVPPPKKVPAPKAAPPTEADPAALGLQIRDKWLGAPKIAPKELAKDLDTLEGVGYDVSTIREELNAYRVAKGDEKEEALEALRNELKVVLSAPPEVLPAKLIRGEEPYGRGIREGIGRARPLDTRVLRADWGAGEPALPLSPRDVEDTLRRSAAYSFRGAFPSEVKARVVIALERVPEAVEWFIRKRNVNFEYMTARELAARPPETQKALEGAVSYCRKLKDIGFMEGATPTPELINHEVAHIVYPRLSKTSQEAFEALVDRHGQEMVNYIARHPNRVPRTLLEFHDALLKRLRQTGSFLTPERVMKEVDLERPLRDLEVVAQLANLKAPASSQYLTIAYYMNLAKTLTGRTPSGHWYDEAFAYYSQAEPRHLAGAIEKHRRWGFTKEPKEPPEYLPARREAAGFRPITKISDTVKSLPKWDLTPLPENLKTTIEELDKAAARINHQLGEILTRGGLDAGTRSAALETVEALADALTRRERLAALGGDTSAVDATIAGLKDRIAQVASPDAAKLAEDLAYTAVERDKLGRQVAEALSEWRAGRPPVSEKIKLEATAVQLLKDAVPDGAVGGFYRAPIAGAKKRPLFEELYMQELRPFTTIDEAVLGGRPTIYARWFAPMRDVLTEPVVRPYRNAYRAMFRFTREYEAWLVQLFKPIMRDKVARQRVYFLLEGKEVKGATEQEREIARRLREEFFDPLFREFGIDPNRYWHNYAPRIREAGSLTEAFDGKVPRQLRFFAEEERVGLLQPRETDALITALAYVRAGARKKFLDPVIRAVDPIIDRYAHPDRKKIYETFKESLLGRPVLEERALESLIARVAQAFGKELGPGRHAREASYFITNFLYLGTLGGNVMTALKNLTQQLLAVTTLTGNPVDGVRYWVRAREMLLSGKAKDALRYCSVLQDREYLESLEQQTHLLERFLGPMREYGLWFFRKADEDNVKISYMMKLLHEQDMGRAFGEAVEAANKFAADTQFLYGAIDSPMLYRSPFGRLFGILMSWPINFWRLIYKDLTPGGTKQKVAATIVGQFVLMWALSQTGLDFMRETPIGQVTAHPVVQALAAFGSEQVGVPALAPVLAGKDVVVATYEAIDRGNYEVLDDVLRDVARQLKIYVPFSVAGTRIWNFVNAAKNDWVVYDRKDRLRYEMTPREALLSLIGPTTGARERREELRRIELEHKRYRDLRSKAIQAYFDGDAEKFWRYQQELIERGGRPIRVQDIRQEMQLRAMPAIERYRRGLPETYRVESERLLPQGLL